MAKATTSARKDGVSQRVRERRKELGLSQRDVELPGASYAYISRIESGTRRPSIEALIAIGKRLGVTALELLTGEPKADCPVCGRSARR